MKNLGLFQMNTKLIVVLKIIYRNFKYIFTGGNEKYKLLHTSNIKNNSHYNNYSYKPFYPI